MPNFAKNVELYDTGGDKGARLEQLGGQFAKIMTVLRLLGELCQLSKLFYDLNEVYKWYVTRILRTMVAKDLDELDGSIKRVLTAAK